MERLIFVCAALALTLGLWAATPQRQSQPADPLESLGIRDLSLPADQEQAIRVLLLTGNEGGAEKLLLDIVAKNPQGWDARVLLARMQYLNRKPYPAIEQLIAADAIRQLPARDRLLLAFAYKASGKPDRAIAELTKLSAQDPKNPEYPYWIGRTESDHRDVEHAIPTLRRVVSDHPDYLPAYEALGIAFEREGKDEAAIGVYQDGIKQDKLLHACPPRLYLNLGALQQQLDRTKEAEENLRKSIRCGPMAQAHYRLGLLLQDSERVDEAIEQFRLAIGLQPGYSPPYYNLAGLYRLKGEKAKAEQALEAFKRISAKEKEIQKSLAPPPAKQ